jgi:uncharacterized protein YeeX (DUF496 family)
MAVRSGSGTGVVVSLVVFVIITVCLLVLTIVFYSGQTESRETQAAAEAALARYVQPAQRSNDMFKRLEASAGRQSVSMYLVNQYEELMSFVDGNPKADLPGVRARAQGYGIGEGDSLLGGLAAADRELRNRQSEIETKDSLLAQKDQELDEFNARTEALKNSHQQEIDSMTSQISAYADEADRYRLQFRQAVDDVEGTVHRMRDQYENQIDDLENQKDEMSQEVYLLRGRVNELQAAIAEKVQRSENPALLVDGRVIDTLSRDEVFINRGRKHRIALGMTFEVYSNAEALRPNAEGEISRGKASLQVVQVGDQTSKCKITRAVPGQPVVSDDVVANAVYDPNYEFKFLVHGKFDVDHDGRPSESEADYLRQVIIDWGGVVVTGEELPGNLDFLVLGDEPPMPGLLPPTANEDQTARWVESRRAHDTYRRLFRQATEAQIPVLNANRFFILTGSTDR